MSYLELSILLFLQLTVILATCRLVGWLGRRFLGQTQVVMEMVAGVLLGPSLFGLLAPAAQAWLFPKQMLVEVAGGGSVSVMHPSMAVLSALSQLGLVLYMFLVGLEFNTGLLRGRARSASLISGAGILVPFALGAGLAWAVYERPDLFGPRVGLFTAILYLGASLSITAFPMLARILYERGIAATRLGTVTLAAGSMDDALAWCLLAVVLATLKATPALAALTIVGGAAYVLVMLYAGRPALRGFARLHQRQGGLSVGSYTALLLVVMACAWFTDVIGIYAVFGGFVAGAVMPRGEFAREVHQRTEMVITSLLLPIFFVFSGLNTKIGLVNTRDLWALTGLVVLLAIIGKGLACALAARAGGESWRDAWTIGTLMNARGLMELIILNVGLDRGVITPTLFTIMILMAVVTTVMASPLYRWISGAGAAERLALAGRDEAVRP